MAKCRLGVRVGQTVGRSSAPASVPLLLFHGGPVRRPVPLVAGAVTRHKLGPGPSSLPKSATPRAHCR